MENITYHYTESIDGFALLYVSLFLGIGWFIGNLIGKYFIELLEELFMKIGYFINKDKIKTEKSKTTSNASTHVVFIKPKK